MVDGVTCHTTSDRTDTPMTRAPGFAENHIFMLGIADLPDRRIAAFIDPADFTGGQTNLSKPFITGHQSRRTTSTAHHLTTATGCKFDIVNGAADGNGTERKTIADFRRSGGTTHQFSTNLKTDWRDDVSLFTIGILEQGQASGATRIIFDRRNSRFDAMLLALKINNTKLLLVTAANATSRSPTKMVAATGLLADFDQAL